MGMHVRGKKWIRFLGLGQTFGVGFEPDQDGLEGGLLSARHEKQTLRVDIFREVKGAEWRATVSVSWEKGRGGEEEAMWEGQAARWPGYRAGRPDEGETRNPRAQNLLRPSLSGAYLHLQTPERESLLKFCPTSLSPSFSPGPDYTDCTHNGHWT